MARKLIVFFDGTWNAEKDRTNVCRLWQSVICSGDDDPYQLCFYDRGVGTRWHDRLLGGAFGHGLSENILQGYEWLARRSREGDEIWIFGFSRGAYTARSLAGMIRKCGLLRSTDRTLLDDAYRLYRNKDVAPDHSAAVAFRQRHSREPRIRFIGVWDTVGALGIPLSSVPFGRDYFQWHDTELSGIVDYAYHAMALDEHRKDYDVTVWTKIKPSNLDVEQRWFIGAHANVGGGYNKPGGDALADLSLQWMQEKAIACGLNLKSEIAIGPKDHMAEIDNSYKDFMYGLYSRFKNPFYREYNRGVNISVDDSVWRRWRDSSAYRPPTLKGIVNVPG